MTTIKDTLISFLSDFTTEILILNENFKDNDKFEKEESKLKRTYATKIYNTVIIKK